MRPPKLERFSDTPLGRVVARDAEALRQTAGHPSTHYAVFIPEKFQVRVYKTDTKQLVAIRTAGDWDTAEAVVKPWGRPDILTVSEGTKNAGMNYDRARGLERGTRGIERRRKVRLD